MKNIIFIVAILFSVNTFCQSRTKYIFMDFGDKSVSLYPFYKIFGANFDPTVTLGGGIEYFKKKHSSIFQEAQLNWYSHDMIGAGVNLSTSLGYQYQINSGYYASTSLGLVGTGFISGRESFTLNQDGQYEKTTIVHWTFGMPVDLSIGYDIGKYGVYCKYRYMVEGRYADILPMLPSSLISIGVRIRLNGLNNNLKTN